MVTQALKKKKKNDSATEGFRRERQQNAEKPRWKKRDRGWANIEIPEKPLAKKRTKLTPNKSHYPYSLYDEAWLLKKNKGAPESEGDEQRKKTQRS